MNKSAHSKSTLESKIWDVVVVGGGMVGATIALGLAKKGFEVLMLEREAPDLNWDATAPMQTRVSALTRASENILKNLGAWKGVQKRRYHAFTDMHVWESVSDAQVHFSSKEIHEPNLGYVVENKVIQAALWDEIIDHEKIAVLVGHALTGLTLQADQARLELDSSIELKTKLVVGADGAFSKTRDMAGIEVKEHDYGQCAVVGCVKTSLPNQDTCWQRYQSDGPFAYLAMQDNWSSIAWYLPTEKMQWALSLSDEVFAETITHASGEKLGQVIEVAKRTAFPLVRRHAAQYVKPHFALVGDAAHTVHPQAGQGVNLGLLDAAALIETLSQSREASDKDWSRLSVLRRYERWRRGDNVIVQRSMEGFDWLFKQNMPLKNEIRKRILPFADQAKPIKNWLMGQALKGREVLPELAQL
ncbi:UbiH/UbiF/VisC/COQ6 family ubiquinone biosynthesis hydroxylase [Hydrogenovibrio sp. 3SP14C1]|uniref:UbiH/UbiF/VisC/COQ6 family ubiquinone biosynthesis hydroxylase n=1 Tax=Hydrogenovibrio sp. 3SP14C1 TaxID=3038774 RepID=UPI002415BA99|nr:UbiH/UbiF/VisC/COQ6 family ubiquinone biosynthesis hydroxylase [Hydrogenovibrio sp. 3SP14C1]MDG4813341.1 UbiH/UbiF/VisC/COQ6 family ubiquinone biosynthesis hydroxylase [Hydrogenovibrio sp. 3SP14C1]